MTNQSAKSNEVDTWPYKVFCILFAAAFITISAWGIFVEHPSVMPEGLTPNEQAAYLLEQEYPGSNLVDLLEYNSTLKTVLLLAETEGEHKILYFDTHPLFISRWGLTAETPVPENATGTYVVGTNLDSWVVTLTEGEAGQFDIHQGIVNPTWRIDFWLSVAAAIAVSLVVTVPANLIRRKKQS